MSLQVTALDLPTTRSAGWPDPPPGSLMGGFGQNPDWILLAMPLPCVLRV
jgi:hypothetical protein